MEALMQEPVWFVVAIALFGLLVFRELRHRAKLDQAGAVIVRERARRRRAEKEAVLVLWEPWPLDETLDELRRERSEVG